jgi:hypothetical protein
MLSQQIFACPTASLIPFLATFRMPYPNGDSMRSMLDMSQPPHSMRPVRNTMRQVRESRRGMLRQKTAEVGQGRSDSWKDARPFL